MLQMRRSTYRSFWVYKAWVFFVLALLSGAVVADTPVIELRLLTAAPPEQSFRISIDCQPLLGVEMLDAAIARCYDASSLLIGPEEGPSIEKTYTCTDTDYRVHQRAVGGKIVFVTCILKTCDSQEIEGLVN